MTFSCPNVVPAVCALLLLASPLKSSAFALYGPVQPWMQTTNGVIPKDGFGGPVCLDKEYRWNLPVVTYGFDKSFLGFFGINGVAAVESAIQVLNNLPPASQIVLTDFPFDSRYVNFEAQIKNLFDLKSATLSLLLEQMGLAKPTRCIFVLREWNPVFLSTPYEPDWPAGTIPNYIVQRNFDPQTLLPSSYVNQTLYWGEVLSGLGGNQNYVSTYPINPIADPHTAIADLNLYAGVFCTELTYDDVGGLVYLLSTNNLNYEFLPPGVVGTGANSNSFVNGAWRPGVDKITFVRHPVDLSPGTFLLTTNYFTDRYVTNGVLQLQQMARAVSSPDFLFYAGDVTAGEPDIRFFSRTGTTNWLNNAAANGNTNGPGPGVIQPQVQIVFNKLGRQFVTTGNISGAEPTEQSPCWASFDGSVNPPVVYPIPQTGTNQLTVRMWLLFDGKSPKNFEWKPISAAGSQFTLQTSTNLTNWTSLFTVTCDSSVCTYFNENPSNPYRFYRLIQ